MRPCYNFLISLSIGFGLHSELNMLLEKLWKSVTPSKVTIFGWRLLRNSLPTHDLLLRRHVTINESDAPCPFCRLHCEDVQRLFLNCSFATNVWIKVCLWLGVHHEGSLSIVDHFRWMGKVCKGQKVKKMRYLIWLTTC